MEEATDSTAYSARRKLLNGGFFLEWLEGAHPDLYDRWVMKPQFQQLYHDAADVITLYGALRTYLKVLSQQPEEDLETIARVTRLMIAIKPQAVEASQEIAGREK